jgi:ATP-dependent Clp protease adaptor protein ClpS
MDSAGVRRQGLVVEAVLLALAAAAGASALWWHQSRPSRRLRELGSPFEADAEVALHVADHEARSRGQSLASIHLLYGLLQDETIASAVRDAGHDPDALEDRVLAALARLPRSEPADEIDHVYGRALHSAGSAGRKVTCRDLWAYLADSTAATLLDRAEIRHVTILFRLCHGAEPTLDGAEQPGGTVHVVLRNDDYTTRDFVCHILETTFGFSAGDAHTRMMQTHEEGRAVLGRFVAAEAAAKVRQVRELAREHGFPLWIGIEPI